MMNKQIRMILLLTITTTLLHSQNVSGYNLSGTFTDINGVDHNYSTFEGEFTFLEGFLTTCSHCITMQPIIQRLYDVYHKNVTFVSIAIYKTEDTLDDVKTFAQEHKIAWTVGLDDGQLKNTLAIDGTPTMFLLDHAGNVVKKFKGETDFDTISYYIETNVFGVTTLPEPTSNPSYGSNNDQSIVGQLFANPIFRAASAIIIIAIIYVKATSKPTKAL